MDDHSLHLVLWKQTVQSTKLIMISCAKRDCFLHIETVLLDPFPTRASCAYGNESKPFKPMTHNCFRMKIYYFFCRWVPFLNADREGKEQWATVVLVALTVLSTQLDSTAPLGLQFTNYSKKMGGCWRWALVSMDGVAPSRKVSVSASVNLPLHHKVQKFSLLAPAHPGGPGKGP